MSNPFELADVLRTAAAQTPELRAKVSGYHVCEHAADELEKLGNVAKAATDLTNFGNVFVPLMMNSNTLAVKHEKLRALQKALKKLD